RRRQGAQLRSAPAHRHAERSAVLPARRHPAVRAPAARARLISPDRSTKRELATVLAVVLGVLLLFCTKAFTIDDPLFLWLGKHIQSNPLDFYGFNVDW